MGLIPEDVIRNVIDRSDIVEVIGRYVTLKKYGSNYKALCPFHHEKSPSFVVNPDKQIFHCFGCGVGGNVTSFLMRQERLEFPQAVRFLADQLGVVIPEDEASSAGPSKKLRDDVYRINELALEFFHERLLVSREATPQAAREYLKARGVDLETVKKFRLGCAPDGWDELILALKDKGITAQSIHQAGLAIARENKSGYYDRFRGRVIFPIFDINSRPVAFGARAISKDDGGAKYINSPETPVYTKGRHLFGLNLTKTAVSEEDSVVVVEGYMDMIMPFIHGVGNIAASLGTALTVDQIRLIRRYSSNVTMLFDTDPAGQAAIVRSLDLLIDEGMNVKVVTLSEGQDPDSFIREFGLEAFCERLKQAVSLFDYKFSWLAAQFDARSIEGKTRICQDMLVTIARFKAEVTKFELMRLLAQKLQLPEDIVFKQAKLDSKTSSFKPRVMPAPQTTPVKIRDVHRSEEHLIALFLSEHGWVEEARKTLTPDDFTSGTTRDLVMKIWQIAQERADWTVSDLLALFPSQEEQSFITRAASSTHTRQEEAAQVFEDCVKSLQLRRLQHEAMTLRQEIEETEKRGQAVDVAKLQQYQDLNRKIKNRGQ